MENITIQKERDQEVDKDLLYELYLFQDNSGILYQNNKESWIKNFTRKMKNGSFNEQLAKKAIRLYFLPKVIQQYNKEFNTKLGLNLTEKNKLSDVIATDIIRRAKEDYLNSK